MQSIFFFEKAQYKNKKWYFVTIIVLTYCEKKLFQCEEKNWEKSLQIRGRKAENL